MFPDQEAIAGYRVQLETYRGQLERRSAKEVFKRPIARVLLTRLLHVAQTGQLDLNATNPDLEALFERMAAASDEVTEIQ